MIGTPNKFDEAIPEAALVRTRQKNVGLVSKKGKSNRIEFLDKPGVTTRQQFQKKPIILNDRADME